MYFSKFPKIAYDIDKTKNYKVVADIFRRIKIRDKILDNVSLYMKYQIQSGDTPETISFKHFGTPLYHWVILITNNITDRFYGWPLDEVAFEKYVNDKYTNPLGTHHYEVAQSSGKTSSSDYSHLIQVDSSTSGATVVTNYEYERRLQDEKREIKLLDKKYLAAFVREFDKLVKL